jgi:hypothetical protein
MHWQQRGRAELSTFLSFGSPWAESCQPVRNLVPALIKAAPVKDAGDARDAGELEGWKAEGQEAWQGRTGQGQPHQWFGAWCIYWTRAVRRGGVVVRCSFILHTCYCRPGRTARLGGTGDQAKYRLGTCGVCMISRALCISVFPRLPLLPGGDVKWSPPLFRHDQILGVRSVASIIDLSGR